MKTLSTALVTFAFSACLLSAQTGAPSMGTPPTDAQIVTSRVARLTTLLSLDSGQQEKVTAIITTEQAALSPLAASFKTARTALQTAITGSESDAITTAAMQIGSLTAQEVSATATADAAIYIILNSDQQTKFAQLLQMGGGRGGPAGFGAGGHGGPH